MKPKPNFILQKLRQAHGANYMLCHRAADEIMKLRKEIEKLKEELKNANTCL